MLALQRPTLRKAREGTIVFFSANTTDNVRYTYAPEMWVTRQCRCKQGVRSTLALQVPICVEFQFRPNTQLRAAR